MSSEEDANEPTAPRKAADDRRRQLRRKVAAVLIVVGLCAGVVVTRAVWDGRSALASGDEALVRGERDVAIRYWRRAARWYVPLAPHVGDAYERLMDLGKQAEAQGDVTTALAAWRGVRGSVLATRSFYTPFDEHLALANARIAELMAKQEGDSAGKSQKERREWHYALLTRDHNPSVFWTVIALMGFAMWIGGGLLFALRGITADDTLVPRNAAYAGILVAIGLVIWMTGLYLA